jgi:ligand-binding sensor domain-containing protein
VGRFVATTALLLASASAFAQTSAPAPALNPNRPITQYLRSVWQRAEGLPQNTVIDVIHTRAGYLWAATQDGLVRFDGLRFTLFNSSTDPALRSDDFTALLEDRQQTLWAGTSNGGLYSLRNGRLQPFTAAALPGDYITDLFEAADGALWIATTDGLSRLAQGSITTFTAAEGLPSVAVRGVTQDGDGVIWVATEGAWRGCRTDGSSRWPPSRSCPRTTRG